MKLSDDNYMVIDGEVEIETYKDESTGEWLPRFLRPYVLIDIKKRKTLVIDYLKLGLEKEDEKQLLEMMRQRFEKIIDENKSKS